MRVRVLVCVCVCVRVYVCMHRLTYKIECGKTSGHTFTHTLKHNNYYNKHSATYTKRTAIVVCSYNQKIKKLVASDRLLDVGWPFTVNYTTTGGVCNGGIFLTVAVAVISTN